MRYQMKMKVDAIQFTGLGSAIAITKLCSHFDQTGDKDSTIPTFGIKLDGKVIPVNINDWIIRTESGMFAVYSDEDFNLTFSKCE